MSPSLGQLILEARRAAGLTQAQLGERLGLQARAIRRWERGESAPRGRHHKALLAALGALKPDLAAQLSQALRASADGPVALPGSAAIAEPVVAPAAALELALLQMADELDLAPRRLRTSVLKLCQRMRQAGVSLEALQWQLGASLAERDEQTTR